jgi:hypothetical protein
MCRSFINFDLLPLVEFVPETSITTEDALDLIRQPFIRKTPQLGGGSTWKETKSGGAESLAFDSGVDIDDQSSVDLFQKAINYSLDHQVT